jgi:hypothetical protein
MSAPYAPTVDYLCGDPDCCWNGCPVVTCRTCGQEWPCADYRAAHTLSQITAQYRYVARKRYLDDESMVAFDVRERLAGR